MENNFRKEFASLLYGNIITGNVSSEDYCTALTAIRKPVIDNFPEKLYRYRTCNELNFDAFDKDVIWAVSASMFNDPYDSLYYADEDFIFQRIKDESSYENLNAIWKYIRANRKLPEAQEKYYGKKTAKKIVESYLKMSLAYIKKIHNQFKDADKQIKEEIKIFLHHCRIGAKEINKIACFSEDVKSITMWSHYSDYHKGFVLEYDLRGWDFLVCNNCVDNKNCDDRKTALLYPVIYTNDRYDATDYAGNAIVHRILTSNGFEANIPQHDQLFPEKMFLNKAVDWEYEKEWRLLCCAKNIVDRKTLKIELKQPTAIYYGTKISEINKKILHSMAEKKGIKEYDMYLVDQKTGCELDFRELSKPTTMQ